MKQNTVMTQEAAREQITAVILAGGKSARMGRDKAQLIRPDGRSQLLFTADCLKEAGIEDILVSGAEVSGLKSLKAVSYTHLTLPTILLV